MSRYRTVLHQNVHAGSNEEVIVEHDESEGERQDIVAGSDLEELAYGHLVRWTVRYRPHMSSFQNFGRHGASPALAPYHAHGARPMGTPHPHAGHAAHDEPGTSAEASPRWDWHPVTEEDGPRGAGSGGKCAGKDEKGRELSDSVRVRCSKRTSVAYQALHLFSIQRRHEGLLCLCCF